MNYSYLNSSNFAFSGGMPMWLSFLGIPMLLLVLWSIFWKGLALWHSGQRGQGWWFVIMLILNTAGILEIIYLFFVIKIKFSELFSKKI